MTLHRTIQMRSGSKIVDYNTGRHPDGKRAKKAAFVERRAQRHFKQALRLAA